MDQSQLVDLAKQLVLLISPLVAQGAIQKLGESTTDVVQGLFAHAWEAIRIRFAGDEDAADALIFYQRKPADPARQQIVADQIVARFKDDPAALAELAELVRALRAATGAPQPQRSHTQTIGGNAQVGTAVAGDVHGGISVVQQSGGINLGSGNTIERIGDIVAGDQVAGDKVRGDKILNYGAPKPADTGAGSIQRLIEIHTRRLRVLEEQAARTGYNTRPEVQTEIEDIRVELARLQALLDQ